MNTETNYTLNEAVDEVLGLLTGLDLTYLPEADRYRAITRQLNRALRANALEQEWSFYSSELSVGTVVAGERAIMLPSNKRPRIINDDAVRFKLNDRTVKWAYFLPRDSLSKYEGQQGLWCSVTRQVISFSRPFDLSEQGLEIFLPVMREPRMFRLPETGEEVPDEILNQPIDFSHPDVIIVRAAYYYAQTDPVMQPRTMTLQADYKDLMYQVMERDESNTDTPFTNSFTLPIVNGLINEDTQHWHPHADF